MPGCLARLSLCPRVCQVMPSPLVSRGHLMSSLSAGLETLLPSQPCSSPLAHWGFKGTGNNWHMGHCHTLTHIVRPLYKLVKHSSVLGLAAFPESFVQTVFSVMFQCSAAAYRGKTHNNRKGLSCVCIGKTKIMDHWGQGPHYLSVPMLVDYLHLLVYGCLGSLNGMWQFVTFFYFIYFCTDRVSLGGGTQCGVLYHKDCQALACNLKPK